MVLKIHSEITPESKPQENPMDRNLKDSTHSSDFSEVLSPLKVIRDSKSAKSRSLSADGNPVWKDDYHTQPIDYFQFVLFNFRPTQNRFETAKAFIFRWMHIDLSVEDFEFTEISIQNRHAQNRFFCQYGNTSKGIKKVYYFDFDFSDGTSDRNRVRGLHTVDYIQNENASSQYLKSYDFTLAEDCRTIRQDAHDPEEINCVPFLTNRNFVIPHVYQVSMTFRSGRGERKVEGRYFVRSKIVGPEVSPLRPVPVRLPAPKDMTEMIRRRIQRAPFFARKRQILNSLNSAAMQRRIEELTEQIEDWESQNRNRLREAETQYLSGLGKALEDHRRQQIKDDQNFERTYDIMRRSVSHINGFNVRMAIRRATRQVENRQVMRAYRARMRYHQRERTLIRLMERLDHMRYLADKHLDDNFNHYYSPEYFH